MIACFYACFFTLNAHYNGLSSVRLSVCVCPVVILTVTHQGAACDVVGVYFSPTLRRTNVLALKKKETKKEGKKDFPRQRGLAHLS